tara:strand:- start:20 stop:595 length:576 start_codon:yes stop_codon:yes gene_type:complete
MNKEDILSAIKSKVDKVSYKQKILIAAFFSLWLVQLLLWVKFPPEDGILYNNFYIYPYTSEVFVILLAISGLIYSIYRKIKSRKANKDKSLISIIYSDYTLSSYASLRILSILYAIIQGSLLGASLAFLLQIFGSAISFNSTPFKLNFIYLIVSLIILLISRVSIEGVSLIFRVAEDLTKVSNKKLSEDEQ